MVFSGSTFASSVCSPVAPNAGVQSKFSVCVAPMARLLMFFVPGCLFRRVVLLVCWWLLRLLG